MRATTLLTLLTMALCTSPIARSSDPREVSTLRAVKSLSTVQRAQLETKLGAEILAELRLADLLEGQRLPKSISVHYQPEVSLVHVEFDLSFLPADRTAMVVMEDQLHLIDNVIISIVGSEFVLRGSVITFGGRPTSAHFARSD